jgi:23S rRNA pseudouridine1911/1915/1917 synthase
MQILFEDYHLIVLNKPAPLLTQAPEGIPSLEALVKAYIKEKYNKPAGVYLGIPHRLDRPVSGVVVFARNSKSAQRIHDQFQNHRVTKIYWALVEGELQPEAGEWRNWLRKLPEESRTELAEPGSPKAKEAIAHYRVLRRFGDRTLVELAPKTGRMHQLRIQLAVRGHPIVGDDMYGGKQTFGPVVENFRDRIIALHARSLTLEHPFRKETLFVEAPLSADWPEITSFHPNQSGNSVD